MTDGAAAEVALDPRPSCWPRSPTSWRAVLCGTPTVAAHDAKPILRSLLELGADITRLTLDTKLAAYLLDPADTIYGLPELLRRHAELELATDGGAPEGQLDFDGHVGRGVPGHRSRGAGGGLRGRAAAQRRSTAHGLTDAERRRSRCRWCGCWPGWSTWASASTSRCCRGLFDSLTAEAERRAGGDRRGGRRGLQRQLHPADAGDPVRQAGSDPGQEDQDRLLDRPGDAREAARRAPDHRAPAALPRGREAAVDLRRGPAGRGRRRRPHPRHVQPDRGPHRSAVLRRAEPAQHPGALRGGAPFPGGVRAGATASSSSWRTTTRSSCASSPTSPRTPG